MIILPNVLPVLFSLQEIECYTTPHSIPFPPCSSEITTGLRWCGSFCKPGKGLRKLPILFPFSGSTRFLLTYICKDAELGTKRTVYLEEKSYLLTWIWYHQNEMTVGSPSTLASIR